MTNRFFKHYSRSPKINLKSIIFLEFTRKTFKGLDTVLFSGENDEAMNEIFENGPVVVEFELYPDFLNYSGGIYKHKGGKSIGYYHAKILGWGHEGGKLFWKAAASFGPNWGA